MQLAVYCSIVVLYYCCNFQCDVLGGVLSVGRLLLQKQGTAVSSNN